MFNFQVKRWAEHHDLLGPFQRKLSGFGLTLMVIFYLQQTGIVPNLQVDYNSTFNTNRSVIGRVAYDFSRQVMLVPFKRFMTKPFGCCVLLRNFFGFITFDSS